MEIGWIQQTEIDKPPLRPFPGASYAIPDCSATPFWKPIVKFVVLGASGYVGSEFMTQITGRGHSAVPLGRQDCNLLDPASLTRCLRKTQADALINCAGYTGKPNVDACEDDKANCLAGNGVLPGVIAGACDQLDLPWGHVSSGCIFTGRRDDGGGFIESDPPNFSFRQNNCSFYSGTKSLGEEVLASAKSVYLWRLRIPFSNVDSSRNYLSKLMRYDRLLDAANSLSYLPEFVAAGLDCLEKELPFGTYNLTNPGSVTARDVVKLIHDSGVSNKSFEFFDDEGQFMEIAARAPRSNCVLDSRKAIDAGLHFSPVNDAIASALANWQAEIPSTISAPPQRLCA